MTDILNEKKVGMKMSTVSKSKNNFIFFGALALMLGALWTFCFIEAAVSRPFWFLIECGLFLFIYGLCIFDAPLIVTLVCLVLSCVGRSYLLMNTSGTEKEDYIFPVTYFFAFLFLIEQLYFAKGKGETVFAQILTWVSRTLPIAFTVVIFLFIYDERIEDYHYFIYNIALTVLVGVIYLIIALMKREEEPGKKKKKKNTADSFKPMRLSFALQIIPGAASCLFFILNRTHSTALAHMLPILWLINLIVLYDKGHPMICALFERMRNRIKSGSGR